MQVLPTILGTVVLASFVATAAALLRGPRVLRWLRVQVLALAVLATEAVLQAVAPALLPMAVTSVTEGISGSVVVAAALAAVAEARVARSVVPVAVPVTLALIVAGALQPAYVALAVPVVWVLAMLWLAWTSGRAARRVPGSLLDARLRMLQGAQTLLAAAALSVLGGPYVIVYVLPLVVGTILLALAIAPPRVLRLVPRETREALRRVDRAIDGTGAGGLDLLHVAMDGLRAAFGGDAAVLVDRHDVHAAGDRRLVPKAQAWAEALELEVAPVARVDTGPDGRLIVGAGTGRGALVVVLPAFGILLSTADREVLAAVADRLGFGLTREETRAIDAKARASLDAAERMRDDLLSTLSHELRTPLTAIMGFAEVLRRHGSTLPPAQAGDMLARIVDRGEHLERVVSAILDLTAVRGRSAPDRVAAYRLRELVDRSVVRAEDRLAGHEVTVDGDAGIVVTDGGAVLAIMEQLLDNAAKFSPQKTPVRVHVSYHRDDASIEVVDHGVGLEGADPEELFAPFGRGGDVLTRNTGGVGIGLAIARELTAQLGGSLTVRSRPGETVFRLDLPAVHPLAPATLSSTPASVAAAESDPTLVPSGRDRTGSVAFLPPRQTDAPPPEGRRVEGEAVRGSG